MSLHDPDMPTHIGPFQIIPNFNGQSRNGGGCSLSNLPMQEPALGRPAEQVDEFVLRGPEIEFEGHFDIRPSVIREMAAALGMVSEAEYGHAIELSQSYFNELQERRAEAAALQQQLDYFHGLMRESLAGPAESEDILDQADTVRFSDLDEEEYE